MRATESASEGLFAPLPQQVATERRLRDGTPQGEVMRLFEHQPQLGGQLYMATDGERD
jgi:hypothetical protein